MEKNMVIVHQHIRPKTFLKGLDYPLKKWAILAQGEG